MRKKQQKKEGVTKLYVSRGDISRGAEDTSKRKGGKKGNKMVGYKELPGGPWPFIKKNIPQGGTPYGLEGGKARKKKGGLENGEEIKKGTGTI